MESTVTTKKKKYEEIEYIFNRPNIQNFLKVKKLEWAGRIYGG